MGLAGGCWPSGRWRACAFRCAYGVLASGLRCSPDFVARGLGGKVFRFVGSAQGQAFLPAKGFQQLQVAAKK